jgi:DNA-directed RNA polymerase specialized sigma24 family protein/ribosome-associated translation inhibitor RaiA
MKYKIHNLKCVKEKVDIKSINDLIQDQIRRFDRISSNYSSPLHANIYFNKEDKRISVVSLSIKLKDGILFIKEKGESVEATIYILFDKLKINLAKKINKERKDYINLMKNQVFDNFNEYIYELGELKSTDSKDIFNQLLRTLLDDIAKYIRSRIRSAEMTSAIKKGKFKVQELLDELHILVYDRFNEMPNDRSKTNTWLYGLADEMLEKHFQEIEFEKNNFERIENNVKAEYKLLEEKFTMNSSAEIVPIEELNENGLPAEIYMANDLYFVDENENSIIDEITIKLNANEIHNYIKKEISKLPVLERTIMNLYLINQMTILEISQIKRISVSETDEIIQKTSKELAKKLAMI